jgi:hypothetical protein
MDRITIEETGLPPWSNPGAYLVYEDLTAPYDSVAAIYNFITFGPDTGKVVYLPFSLEAIVDSTTVACDPPPGTSYDTGFGVFHGRANLLADVLLFFGEPLSPTATEVIGGDTPVFRDGLFPVTPNPSNPDVDIAFNLARPGVANISVYDVLGRRVATLASGNHPAGRHSISWDGRDENGGTVASGIYFVEMRTPRFSTTRKLALVR